MSLGIINRGNRREKMITFNTMDDKLKDTLDAWLKYGTVFLVYRLCTYYFFDSDNPNAELFDRQSLQLALFILIGFTIYYLLIKPFIPFNLQHPILQNIGNDTLMFGTVLISTHLMESYMNDGQYFNSTWLKNTGLILLSFAAYRVFVDPFIPRNKLNATTRPIVDNWAQYGTFLIVFRLLEQKSLLDQKWILSVLFALLGFTAYDLVTKKLITIQ
jgi:hypothetical protein